MEDKTKLATFRVDRVVWEDFKRIAGENGKTASELLIDFIGACIDGRIDLGSLESLTSIQPQSNLDINQTVEEAIAPLLKRLEAVEKKLAA